MDSTLQEAFDRWEASFNALCRYLEDASTPTPASTPAITTDGVVGPAPASSSTSELVTASAGLAEPLAPAPTIATSLVVAPAVPTDTIVVALETCSTKCPSCDVNELTPASTPGAAPTSPTATIDIIPVRTAAVAGDGTLDGKTIKGAPSTADKSMETTGVVRNDAEEVPGYVLPDEMPQRDEIQQQPWPPPLVFCENSLRDELQEIFGNVASVDLHHCSSNCPRGTTLTTPESQVLQLPGNFSSSVSCGMAKDQCSAKAKCSFNALLLRVQKWAPDIQCVQPACVNSYALYWHERYTIGVMWKVLVGGSVLTLFSSGFPNSFGVADLLEDAYQLKCTNRAQGLTGQHLVEAVSRQSIEAKLPDSTSGHFLDHHSRLGFVILGVLATWPHFSTIQITELTSKDINFQPASILSVERLLLQSTVDLHPWFGSAMDTAVKHIPFLQDVSETIVMEFQQLNLLYYYSASKFYPVALLEQQGSTYKLFSAGTRQAGMVQSYRKFYDPDHCQEGIFFKVGHLSSPIVQYTDHGYKWLMLWSKSENKGLVSCYLTIHRHSEVVKWYMESTSLVVYKWYTDLNLSSTSFGMMRASPPGLEERQPHAIFLAACTVMLQSTELYSRGMSSWTNVMPREEHRMLHECRFSFVWYSFMLEQMIVSFLQALVSSCFMVHINQCDFALFQWKIAWSHQSECSEIASADLKDNLLPDVDEDIIQAKCRVVCYRVDGAVVGLVCTPRFRPTTTYTLIDDIKHNNSMQSSQTLILAFLEVTAVIGFELWNQLDKPITLIWSSQLIALLSGAKQGNDLRELSLALLSVWQHAKYTQWSWDPGGCMFALYSSRKTVTTTLHSYEQFQGSSLRLAYAFQIWFVAWIVDGLESSTCRGQAPSQGGRNIPQAEFSNQVNVSNKYHIPFVNHIHIDCDCNLNQAYSFDDIIYYREDYHRDSRKTNEVHTPWDPGKSALRYPSQDSAWGQAEFQGGRDVRTSAYMGCFPGATTWAWPVCQSPRAAGYLNTWRRQRRRYPEGSERRRRHLLLPPRLCFSLPFHACSYVSYQIHVSVSD